MSRTKKEYEDFLKIIRAKIAIHQFPKKNIAFKLGISRSLFSQYLSGELQMSERIIRELGKELGISRQIDQISLEDLIDEKPHL